MLKWFRKQLTRLVHSLPRTIFSLLPRTRFDYAREVGHGYGSSVIMAPIKFIQRVFPEAPLKLKREEEILDDHELIRLIRQPNRFYSGNNLWRATIASWILDGNAYWLKVLSRMENVLELWWIPPWLIAPAWPTDGSEFISHYEYRPTGSEPILVPMREVVHFRNGLDPRNSRLGMSDLHCLLREIFTDDEASNFIAALIRNMGVPGLIISPKEGTVQEKDANATEGWFKARTTGDRRGDPLVMRGPTDVHQFAWSPAQLELGGVRDLSEERVTAVIGVPAAVVGFGTGLQQTKVGATMRELVKLAWIGCITPMQRAMAETVEFSLMPDFEGQGSSLQVFFDDKMVEALQETELERAKRLDVMIQGGWAKVAEGRKEFRLPVTEADDIYLRRNNVTPVRTGKSTTGSQLINGEERTQAQAN